MKALYHTVSIKGTMAQAILAANEHSIILRSPTKHPQFNEVIAYVDGECLPELYQWYSEPHDYQAPQAEPGTLLWFDAVGSMPFAYESEADTADMLALLDVIEKMHAADAAALLPAFVTGR